MLDNVQADIGRLYAQISAFSETHGVSGEVASLVRKAHALLQSDPSAAGEVLTEAWLHCQAELANVQQRTEALPELGRAIDERSRQEKLRELDEDLAQMVEARERFESHVEVFRKHLHGASQALEAASDAETTIRKLRRHRNALGRELRIEVRDSISQEVGMPLEEGLRTLRQSWQRGES